jgi:hypothetical protein
VIVAALSFTPIPSTAIHLVCGCGSLDNPGSERMQLVLDRSAHIVVTLLKRPSMLAPITSIVPFMCAKLSLQVWIYRDKATGMPKGECTVTYEDPFSAASAVSWFGGKDFRGAENYIRTFA